MLEFTNFALLDFAPAQVVNVDYMRRWKCASQSGRNRALTGIAFRRDLIGPMRSNRHVSHMDDKCFAPFHFVQLFSQKCRLDWRWLALFEGTDAPFSGLSIRFASTWRSGIRVMCATLLITSHILTPSSKWVSIPYLQVTWGYGRRLALCFQTTISRCMSRIAPNVYCSSQVIGESLGGNPVHLLTITGQCSVAEISKKRVVFLSSRVHPGESNASWMMHGRNSMWSFQRSTSSGGGGGGVIIRIYTIFTKLKWPLPTLN